MRPGERYGVAKGNIPNTLRVILRDRVDYETPAGTFRANPACVTDPAARTSLETATYWAAYGYGPGTTKTPEVVMVDNTPLEWLRVVDIDVRGEGGRAWKVIDCRGWVTDLREDVFLDCVKMRVRMENDGRDGGLLIWGPFRWVRFGTQMRLALIGSDLYQQIERSAKAKANPDPKIKAKDLAVGGVYMSAAQDWVRPVVFLGRMRVQGQVRLAFMEFGNGGHPDNWIKKELNDWLQQTFQDTINRQQFRGEKLPVTLLASHSLTRKIGATTILVDKLPLEKCRFSNGYGEQVCPDPEGWL